MKLSEKETRYVHTKIYNKKDEDIQKQFHMTISRTYLSEHDSQNDLNDWISTLKSING